MDLDFDEKEPSQRDTQPQETPQQENLNLNLPLVRTGHRPRLRRANAFLEGVTDRQPTPPPKEDSCRPDR